MFHYLQGVSARVMVTALRSTALALLVAAPAHAATLYVSTTGSDGNVGSIEQPFRNIKRGLRVLREGDTLYIRAGIYTEHLVENDFGASGSPSAWITVAGYPGETVIIRNGGTYEVIRFQDGSKHHIEWKNLIIDGGGVNFGDGIFVVGFPACCGDATVSHNLTFTNVEVKNTWGNGVIGGGSNHRFINLRVHGNGRVPPETYSPGANGVYFTGDNSLFEGGEYYDNLCFGIRIVDSSSAHRASNNVISRVKSYTNGSGKGLSGSSRCGSSGGGIVLGDSNNLLANSLIYDNSVGVDIMGLSGKMAQDAKIFHNTIYGNKGHAVGVGLFAGATRTDIRNNIMWRNGSNVVAFSAAGTLQEGNVTTDPAFTNDIGGDFTLQAGSVAIDRGVALFEITKDFVGQARPKGYAQDAGAFEFGTSSAPSAPRSLRALR